MGFERTGSEEVWRGRILSVRVGSFRFDDGEEATREWVVHPGAVAVVAHDGECVYMISQPREAVDEQRLLELPAGKLDPGEEPLATGRRELAEEIGKGARTWRLLTTFYSSPGFSDEVMHVYLATDLYDAPAEVEENERIEIERVPLSRLDELITRTQDAKSLVGLLWLRACEGAAA
jgi:8-oxo-dGTP pyrophosphatase MutT (NUDIX family)